MLTLGSFCVPQAKIAANRVVLSHQMRSLARLRAKGPRATHHLPYRETIRHPNLGQSTCLGLLMCA